MSEQITITLSKKIYRQIVKQAKQDRKNVADVVKDVVTNTFSLENSSAISPAREKMLQEIEAYKNMHASLVKTHLGQFVAIFEGQLVDHDPDKNLLFLRVKKKFPNKVVLQRQVLADADPILHFRSPRFIQK